MLLLQDTERKIKGKNANDLSKTTCESEIEHKWQFVCSSPELSRN